MPLSSTNSSRSRNSRKANTTTSNNNYNDDNNRRRKKKRTTTIGQSFVSALILKSFLWLLVLSSFFTILLWIYLPDHGIYPKSHPMDDLSLRDDNNDVRNENYNKNKRKEEEKWTSISDNNKSTNINYFMVFSTSCSPSQDWQSYVFFYSAWKVRQPGDVIRIASGCSEEQRKALTKLHTEQILIMSDRFHVHFAPACEDSRSKYFNKPFGLRDYMEKQLGYYPSSIGNNYDNNKHDDDIIMIVDPDMMLLRPLTHEFDLDKTDWVVQDHWKSATVTHGHPISQAYGFGNSWIESIRDNLTYVIAEIDENSPVLGIDKYTAGKYYPSGPPYLATGRDMYNIAWHWTKFVVRIHDLFPKFMSEMHGYSFASAHLRLPHQLARSFMVSDVDTDKGEGWGFLKHDSVDRSTVCIPDSIPTKDLPYVFHYCQRYALGRWFIGKYKIPKNTFNCDAPMFREPPEDVAVKYDWFHYPGGQIKNFANKPLKVLQNGWSMCRLIASLNEVLTNFKNKHCDPKVANFSKSFIFHKEDDFNAFLQGEVPELPPP
mmetsp:Transcript_19145/g.21890  ORF Transcript_19145/g.21890 Transcript_19145/m.21890 type:complete len:544 (+) Transcript_19145:153-1784(+)